MTRASAGRAMTARATLNGLADQLESLREEMRRRHVAATQTFEQVHPVHRRGAQNLVDYLTLRRHDIRSLQASLARLGLSSLGRADEHVLTTIERVLEAIRVLAHEPGGAFTEAAVDFDEGEAALAANASALVGPPRPERTTRILVTMPAEAAEDAGLVRELLERGMDCARINAAHDGPDAWAAMARHLRATAEDLATYCRVFFDLPGPKLRTGPVSPGPRVARLRPKRDIRGRTVEPARARLVPATAETDTDSTHIPVAREWLLGLRSGDEVSLHDASGAPRVLRVDAADGEGADVEALETTYLESGIVLRAPDGSSTPVGELAPVERSLRVRPGDLVTLTAAAVAADADGTKRPDGSRSFAIGCTPPEALDALRLGQRVFFDDGKLGGAIVARRAGAVDVAILQASRAGTKLGADKGVNFPDADLAIPAVGVEDEPLIAFAVTHADAIELSFAQRVEDVTELQRRLAELGGEHLGVVLKIETVQGFNHLPELLLAAMRSERVGVMVARGDLAVECGYERLAEVQEEILGLCAAAHVPVIWATEVLDQMARTGRPSRAEVSDAAMAGRAECVMLNKGPHILEAVSTLDDILRRMSAHQRKKSALLRRLRSWVPESTELR